jgi:hypothetical protein
MNTLNIEDDIPSSSTYNTELQQTRRRKIDCKPELIITSLQRFYTSNPDISKVMPYFLGTSTLSLRIIDWFVTKYCRKSFTHYPLEGKDFIVYRSYKSQLKAYSKQYFDPNCRRERIMFKIGDGEPFMTTIGQLNFFRWALECKVLNYIEANQEVIRTGYNSFLRETTSLHKKNKSDTQTSTGSTASTASSASTLSATSAMSSVSASSATSGLSMVSANEILSPTAPARVTRRRRMKQTPSALRQLQISEGPIHLEFT